MAYFTQDYPGQRKPPRFAYLRSFLPLVSLILLFSIFLASYSLLSHFRSPAKKQQIGWQAWDVVEFSQSNKGNDDVETGNGTMGDQQFVPSIPLDNWVRLPAVLLGVLWIEFNPADRPCD